MSLTAAQAQRDFIMNSMVNYLGRKVKVKYDTLVAATPTWSPKTLDVGVGDPPDPNKELDPPQIAVNFLEASSREEDMGIGMGDKWRHDNFVLYCYPSVLANDLQDLKPQAKLISLLRDALASTTIKIIDYTVSTPGNIKYCADVMEILNVAGPMPRGGQASLSKERYRFDFHVSVRYPVASVVADDGL